ncbi:hypothetical protein QTO34_003137 [Cnephaeus nilssonii]|uniref:Uncharacterized protein n=1 Tax=Cnephaeus nilssonii TaxID=3371016 RepID=A0AA40HQ44_CNENI|nr:hypothetical protein QTO34_003137 [Eptesicus nilssonii]
MPAGGREPWGVVGTTGGRGNGACGAQRLLSGGRWEGLGAESSGGRGAQRTREGSPRHPPQRPWDPAEQSNARPSGPTQRAPPSRPHQQVPHPAGPTQQATQQVRTGSGMGGSCGHRRQAVDAGERAVIRGGVGVHLPLLRVQRLGGRLVLCSLSTFKDMWVTSDDYNEKGPSAVSKRSF